MSELEQAAIPEEVASTTEEEIKTGEAVTPEVEETDEQKNERAQREAAERSEKKARGVQKRMDELTADKYAERKRADELAATNARILALLEQRQTPQSYEGEPRREDYADDVAYLRDVAKYDAKQEAQSLLDQRMKAERENQARVSQEQQEQAVAKDFITRRKEAEKSIPDYRSVIEDWEPNIPPSVQETIVRLPDGPLIAYHLAKNPDLEAQFHSQPSYMHGVLLGQLLTTIKAAAKPTSAPAPGKPVASKAGTSTEPPSDPEQYRAWADKHLR